MRKINRSFFIAWSIIAVLVFANVAVATTISTNITTVNTTGTGTLTITGLSILSGGASVSNNFEVGSEANAFRVIGSSGDTYLEDLTASGSLSVTGLTTSANASVSAKFEVGTNAFTVTGASGNMIASGSAVIGYTAASASGFEAQFVQHDNTATLSVDFDSGSAKGTCLRFRDTLGALIYCRIIAAGTTLSCTTVSCK